MPYKDVGELPERIQNSLQKHAQEVHLAAHNNASQQYTNPGDVARRVSKRLPTELPGQP
jgi:cation transport regulator